MYIFSITSHLCYVLPTCSPLQSAARSEAKAAWCGMAAAALVTTSKLSSRRTSGSGTRQVAPSPSHRTTRRLNSRNSALSWSNRLQSTNSTPHLVWAETLPVVEETADLGALACGKLVQLGRLKGGGSEEELGALRQHPPHTADFTLITAANIQKK